jgi:protein subunit release factor A
MSDLIKPEEVDLRVIDQRIGAGIGGMDTVIRLYHKPSGILIEVPQVTSGQYHDREIAVQMLEAALTHPKYREANT